MSDISDNIHLIIKNLSVHELQKLQTDMGPRVLIIKFGADWCGPCKKIAPAYNKFIETAASNFIFADINIDDNMDLYVTLKKNKMVNGIPVFFAYYGNTKRDKWFIPDNSIVGADDKAVNDFFQQCKNKALELAAIYGKTVKEASTGYSYYK